MNIIDAFEINWNNLQLWWTLWLIFHYDKINRQSRTL